MVAIKACFEHIDINFSVEKKHFYEIKGCCYALFMVESFQDYC